MTHEKLHIIRFRNGSSRIFFFETTLLLLIFFSSVYSCFGQNKKKLITAEISAGGEIGWWIYNKGSENSGIPNTLGWDRTHLSFIFPVGFSALLDIKKWKVGLEANYTKLFDNQMIGSLDADFFYDRYRIAEKTVDYFKYGMAGEYEAINSKKYSLSPHLGVGLFNIYTIHPEKDNFGNRYYLNFGLQNGVKLTKLHLIFRPFYQVLTIKPKTEKNHGEEHKIYSIGLVSGLRF